MKIKQPWQQGELDGLCGLYSCINAIHSVIGLDRGESEELFVQGIDYLNDKGNLANFIKGGMNVRKLAGLLRSFKPYINEHGYDMQIKYICKDCRNITSITNTLKTWLEDDLQCAIIGFGHGMDHWTCINAPFKKTISLFDSDGLKSINIRTTTGGQAYGERCYTVDPNEVIGIRFKEI